MAREQQILGSVWGHVLPLVCHLLVIKRVVYFTDQERSGSYDWGVEILGGVMVALAKGGWYLLVLVKIALENMVGLYYFLLLWCCVLVKVVLENMVVLHQYHSWKIKESANLRTNICHSLMQ
eukprot:4939660-Ditylum_brightwellii.AAC.1